MNRHNKLSNLNLKQIVLVGLLVIGFIFVITHTHLDVGVNKSGGIHIMLTD